jgi:hypothetical protein
MGQTRLKYLNNFYSFNINYILTYHLLENVEFDIEPEDDSKKKNNNNYFEKKKLKKKNRLILKIKLKKIYNNSHINNMLFF